MSNSLHSFLVSYSFQSLTVRNSEFKRFTKVVVLGEANVAICKELDSNFFDRTDYNIDPTCVKNFTFQSCEFFDIGDVGAIQFNISSLELRCYSCDFLNCLNTNNGGAVWASNCVRYLSNACTYQRCHSERNGGGIYAENCTLDIFRSQFSFCTSNNGGGFYYNMVFAYRTFFVQSCIFESNFRTPLTGPAFTVVRPDSTSPLLVNMDFTVYTESYRTWPVFSIEPNTTSLFISSYRFQMSVSFNSVIRTPSNKFTPTPSPTPTQGFSLSGLFSESMNFTTIPPTINFTASSDFVSTIQFNQTNLFTRSAQFAPTERFSQTNTFITASPTSYIPPPSFIPPTKDFTASSGFSESQQFTASFLFSPSMSPAPTASPPYTWADLNLGLMILGIIILIVGIIANLFLCCILCKPNEIVAQQIIIEKR